MHKLHCFFAFFLESEAKRQVENIFIIRFSRYSGNRNIVFKNDNYLYRSLLDNFHIRTNFT